MGKQVVARSIVHVSGFVSFVGYFFLVESVEVTRIVRGWGQDSIPVIDIADGGLDSSVMLDHCFGLEMGFTPHDVAFDHVLLMIALLEAFHASPSIQFLFGHLICHILRVVNSFRDSILGSFILFDSFSSRIFYPVPIVIFRFLFLLKDRARFLIQIFLTINSRIDNTFRPRTTTLIISIGSITRIDCGYFNDALLLFGFPTRRIRWVIELPAGHHGVSSHAHRILDASPMAFGF